MAHTYAQQGATVFSIGFAALLMAGSVALADSYKDQVRKDGPVAYWSLDAKDAVRSAVGKIPGAPKGARLGQPGPRPKRFKDFSAKNSAVLFPGDGSSIRIKDPGAASVFDFDKGDSITIEAWVNPKSINDQQQVYIIGKGRTGNKGLASNNQNWALRLRGVNGECRISFLFRSASNLPANHPKSREDWHRWNSDQGFAAQTGWHHVAVTYTFGNAGSVAGYIDGRPVKGRWDYGGPSNDAPVVDDDEVWIGSSMRASPNSSFNGLIDEVAIYRKTLSARRLASRFKVDPKIPAPGVEPVVPVVIKAKDLPTDAVRVELLNGIPDKRNWSFNRPKPVLTYHEPAFGFARFPKRYDEQGLIADWSNPFILRAAGRITLPKGDHKILLRTRNSAKLHMDGKLLVTSPFTRKNASGHDKVPDLPKEAVKGLRVARPGHVDRVIDITSPGAEHVFVMEFFLGGQKLRQEIGETSVSILLENDPDHIFRLLGPTIATPLTDEHWPAYARDRIEFHRQLDTRNRMAAAANQAEIWNRRHKEARDYISQLKPIEVPKTSSASNAGTAIDRFVSAHLDKAGIKPASLTDDWAFLRRVCLDTIGIVPPQSIIDSFMKDKSPDRRAKLIDRLLQHPRWADNWVGYWQDVLAENPGILKPMLNNTGPFRYWIYESFVDNKPIDRFATELILMGGSKYGGGPAGFAMATQNDVPMAAKAQVIGQAFLAMNMKCARCHDAPFHDFTQKHLFSLAAMLKRGDQNVPKSSSVPVSKERLKRMIISVTLSPGQKVKPDWPFEQIIPTELKGKSKDSRRQLAEYVTSYTNDRFAKVVVNRLWKRYLGRGLFEPVDDLEAGKVTHAKLLEYLARQLVSHDYDLKHVARLILNSQTYQRVITDRSAQAAAEASINKPYLFASPVRKRMSAEQLVDSLFAAAGKEFGSEELNFDVDGRRPVTTFLNLGHPRSAWQFTSLSNERDRPALAMPKAQSFVDVLSTFGWRQSRQDSISQREATPNVLQPAILSNGILTKRAAGLSDDSAFTKLALKDQPVERFVEQVFSRVLCRPPSADESKLFVQLLGPGYSQRRVEPTAEQIRERAAGRKLHAVSWSNHLSAEATKIKIEMERAARAGDPPSLYLNSDWRQRAEDMNWALINSPEFIFVP